MIRISKDWQKLSTQIQNIENAGMRLATYCPKCGCYMSFEDGLVHIHE